MSFTATHWKTRPNLWKLKLKKHASWQRSGKVIHHQCLLKKLTSPEELLKMRQVIKKLLNVLKLFSVWVPMHCIIDKYIFSFIQTIDSAGQRGKVMDGY